MEPEDDTPTRAVARGTAGYERLGRISLKVLSGPDAGRVVQVPISRGQQIRGGRSETCHVVLRDDDQVSANHFSLHFEPAGAVLRDLGSTNGVYVHEVRVREAIIELDTVFRVGATALQLTAAERVVVPLSAKDHFGELYGWCPEMRELFDELERVAAMPSSALRVLITGETGTGKELVARGLHDLSERAQHPFVVLDCSTLPRELAEAIVLGYGRGAFTHAAPEQPGVFEQAHRGTLFLDELGELPLDLQPKLLRVLERGEVARFNERNKLRKVDVRVICATNRDLQKMVSEGRFRSDLYFRIYGKHIELPSLSERGDDVILLADRFLRALCESLGMPPKQLTAAAHQALRAAPWPGNVRQLKQVIECAAQLTRGPTIDARDLHLGPGGITRRDQLDASPLLSLRWDEAQVGFQREYFKALMQRVGARRGWIGRAAELAGMDRSGFVKALKRLGLYRHAMEDAAEEP
ncbi:sigma 54-interacting transcriptional regulator [Nannocystis sp. ILAH1]|uniref:sigma 54-interacting transcriptional regulator n=1 Tax=unclassified Nannocystis TaxID=2627009 RepID=UPI00226DD583|nr:MULTISPECIES: sigma 54-interacting transcriptional regulator [unclassified Nannocystis]MCY0991706.1 sigma 54-interacting transcriptional regulator [Nannocystis sp. ILAH1]MCY1067254.1 sigma 54-interacting transcriptional regulator [Nannocystis sp. RBIL2]